MGRSVATKNVERRGRLAEAQDLPIETVVDAGELHARVEDLQAEVAALRAKLDAMAPSGERGLLARHG